MNINLYIKHFFIKTLVVLSIALYGIFSGSLHAEQMRVVEDQAEVEKAHGLLAAVKKADRFVNKLDSLTVIDFPIGIKARDSKDAEKYAIILSEMVLRNGETFLTAYMAFEVPGTKKKIAFKGTDIPFSYSGGIKGEATLELVSDFDIKLSKDINLILKGNGKTKVKWDCNGFKIMDVVGDLLLDSARFIPENPDGTLKSGALRSSVNISVTDWNNFMFGVSFDPFQIKGVKGVGFSVTNAAYDMSDLSNPTGITFAPKYQTDYFIDGNPNIWRGIYIQEVQVRMPPQFRKKTGAELRSDSVLMAQDTSHTLKLSDSVSTGRTTFYAHNLLIDELGFTGRVGTTDLLTLEEGDLGGWAFSVNHLEIDIQCNQLVAAGFSGQIYVPQFKQNSLFNYSAQIGLDDTYAFSVAITDTMSMSVWAANLEIQPNSALNIEVTDSKFIPSLYLNGKISINSSVDKDDNSSSKLAIAEIPFQGMKIQTVSPYFGVEYISFGMSQNKFSKFPVSINNIGFESRDNRVGIHFSLRVNFVGKEGGTFGGDGDFTIWGKRNDKKWKYDGMDVDRIAINIKKGDAFEIRGEITFIRGDAIYGNGFKGSVDASFAKFGMEATALFGTVDGYRYWFTDALVSLPVGIPAGPISLYGFGGGAYYHMKQAGIGGTVASEIGKTTSGIYYAPDKKSGLGIKAMVEFGLSGKKETFNGDVEFGISFTTSGGLNQISFVGNAYFATGNFSVSKAGLLDKAKGVIGKDNSTTTENASNAPPIPVNEKNAAIKGGVSMLFDFPNKCFHSTFYIDINVAGGLIKGIGPGGRAGWGVMHFEPSDWYVHIGTPENPNGIVVLNMAKMTNYFMAGKSVPELPLPPQEIIDGLKLDPVEYTTRHNAAALGEGSGFALGSYFSIDTGERTFLIFYGRFGCGLGFDILMKKYGDVACEGSGQIGINGWYAQGQAYAWIAAAVGIKVDLPFYSGKYTIFEMELAALLQAKAPNPFWMKGNIHGGYNILNGLVKGECDFEFEIGQQCKVVSETSPFGGMPIIGDVKPMDKEEKVNVFTTPQAIFNMPINEVIEFKDDNGTVKTYRIKLNQFNVNSTDGTQINGELRWNDRNDVAVFKSRDILPGETAIKVSISVTFEELKNGNWFTVTKDGGAVVETREITFITGPEPDHVPQENVLYSYPGYRAFNYYKAEANTNYVKLDFGQPNLFTKSSEWVYKARVTPVAGGAPTYMEMSYDNANTQINLSIPQSIQNNKVYRLEVVRLPAKQAEAIDVNVDQQTETVKLQADGYSANIDVTTQEAETSRSELQEKVLYTMEFRSSMYSTFAAKLKGLSYSDGISWEHNPLIHSLTVNISGERFDTYEVINLQTGTMIDCTPILSETPWYNTYLKPLFNISANDLRVLGAAPFKPDPLTTYFFQSNGTRNLTEKEAASGVTSEITVISGMKNYIAKYASAYLYDMKGKISHAYVNKSQINGKLYDILNADFMPIQYGVYPVGIKYTLPGTKSAKSEHKHIINFID